MAENLAPFATAMAMTPNQGTFTDVMRARALSRQVGIEEQLAPYRMTTLQQQADLTKFQMRRAQKRAELEDEFMELMSQEMARVKAGELDALEDELSVQGAYEMLMSKIPADPPFAPDRDLELSGAMPFDFVGPLGPLQSRREGLRLLPSRGVSGQGVGMPRFGRSDPLDVSAPRVGPMTPLEAQTDMEMWDLLVELGLLPEPTESLSLPELDPRVGPPIE